MEFWKTVTGKVVGGAVALIVIIGVIAFLRMEEATKEMLVSGTGKILSWLGIVLLMPGVTFFIIAWVAKMDSNTAGGVLVFCYTAAEAILLGWLFSWSFPTTTAKAFWVVGALIAGVYNLLVCDWLAEKFTE